MKAKRNPGAHRNRAKPQRAAKSHRHAVPTPCSKKAYRDKTTAKLALRELASKRRQAGEHGERSVYRCPECDLYHLTSCKKGRGWGSARPKDRQDDGAAL
jgi:hypothetical protein